MAAGSSAGAALFSSVAFVGCSGVAPAVPPAGSDLDLLAAGGVCGCELAGGIMEGPVGNCVDGNGEEDELDVVGVEPWNRSPRFFAQWFAKMQTTIQIATTTIVIRVNTSPAFAPKALEPPIPPSAPARPPPRPRWTSTSKIKKTARSNKINPKKKLMTTCRAKIVSMNTTHRALAGAASVRPRSKKCLATPIPGDWRTQCPKSRRPSDWRRRLGRRRYSVATIAGRHCPA